MQCLQIPETANPEPSLVIITQINYIMKAIIPSLLLLLLLSNTNESHSFSPTPHSGHRTALFYHSHSPLLHPTATTRGANNSKEKNSLSSLSVTELKRILSDRSIDYRDCLEKSDLIERILSSSPSTGTNTASSSSSWGVLSQEENRVVDTFTRASPSVAYIQTVQVKKNGFELKGMEVPVGAGSGFLWDERVREYGSLLSIVVVDEKLLLLLTSGYCSCG